MYIALFLQLPIIYMLVNSNFVKYTADYNVGTQWYLGNGENAVDAICIWEKDVSKKEVIVAVIDTGVDYNHEVMKNHFWINRNEIPNDGIDNDMNGYIDDINGWNFVDSTRDVLTGKEYYENDHGTQCASIISSGAFDSEMKGINYGSSIKIMTLKVLTGIEKMGEVENIIKAIKYAESNGADICNLSMNFTEENIELSTVIKQSEMLFVVSAGNNGVDIDQESVYLGSYNYQNVFSVAAVDKNGELYQQSNYGKESIDIAAPGVDIYCAVVNGYDYDTGTSMATAVVTGVCAMTFSTGKIENVLRVKNVVMENAMLKPAIKDKVKCGGIVNMKNIIANVN